MAFQEGNTLGKGRPPGATNKTTAELRALLSTLVHDNWAVLAKKLPTLPDDEQVGILVKILPYVLPKLAPVEAPPEEAVTFTRSELVKELLSRIPQDELLQMIDEMKANE